MQRNSKLDLLRGHYLLAILIDHFSYYTGTSFFVLYNGNGKLWVSAAEGFVFFTSAAWFRPKRPLSARARFAEGPQGRFCTALLSPSLYIQKAFETNLNLLAGGLDFLKRLYLTSWNLPNPHHEEINRLLDIVLDNNLQHCCTRQTPLSN